MYVCAYENFVSWHDFEDDTSESIRYSEDQDVWPPWTPKIILRTTLVSIGK